MRCSTRGRLGGRKEKSLTPGPSPRGEGSDMPIGEEVGDGDWMVERM